MHQMENIQVLDLPQSSMAAAIKAAAIGRKLAPLLTANSLYNLSDFQPETINLLKGELEVVQEPV